MPNLIVIPLLTGMHWRTIAIQIDYKTNTLNIIWDDPYGNFPEELRNELLQPVRANALNLINRQNNGALTEDNIIIQQHQNIIDQQGRSNGWDCGPITLSNARDYTTHYVQNHNLNEVIYTIGENTQNSHTDDIINARISHMKEYSQVTDFSIDQDRLNNIRLAWKQDKENKLKAIYFQLNKDIFLLEPFYLEMFFSVLENYQQFTEVDNQVAVEYA
eukprot:GHVR01045931.1.p1 GENE.GHVR01045931.1~~GHVR01045931.1.p1  ORF type:complete len:217 (+),score=25.90 GHVR01045931.1:1649-2299(+)